MSCVQSEVVDDHHSVPDTAADHQRFERLQQVTHTVHLKGGEGGRGESDGEGVGRWRIRGRGRGGEGEVEKAQDHSFYFRVSKEL